MCIYNTKFVHINECILVLKILFYYQINNTRDNSIFLKKKL